MAWAQKHLKVVSDGRPQGTKVIDADTGEAIAGVISITWEMDITMAIPKCTIIAYGVPLEVEAKAANVATDKLPTR